MKRLFLGIFIGMASFTVDAQEMIFDSYGTVSMDGQIKGFENKTMYLHNQNLAKGKKPMDSCTTDAKGKFVWKTAIPFKDYYAINFRTSEPLNLVLQAGDSITFNADVTNINATKFERSKDSQLLLEFLVPFTEFKQLGDSLKLVVAKDRSKGPEVNAYYKPFAEEFVRMRSEFIKKNQHSPALLVVLGSFDQNQEWKAYTEVVRLLDLSFKGSPTVESVKTYVLKKNAQIEAQRKANEAFAPGKIPPDIALPGVDGDTLRLSDLKGKVVLIDFWASWCKPCRMENPNVVRNYQKYNKDGFEVFSVSLDNPGHGDRWKGAIQQDGLIWPNHVSDLKGWQSSAAKAYNVRSIPFTVLLDREGKIIGTNIRGPKLEENLKTIFGY